MKIKLTILLNVALLAGVAIAAPLLEYPRVPGVTYADQPTGIELSTYLATWPNLERYVLRLRASQRTGVKADLLQQTTFDGALNLLAQLQREDGALDEADKTIDAAIALQPKRYLHSFQQAMICFARLMRGSGMLERWKWQQRTRDAYQRTLDLNPRSVEARYYVAYTFMNTPAIGGGDKQKALELSNDGIDLGLDEFYVVRADAHRLRGEIEAAFADYDNSIQRRVFKLSAFLATGQLALERRDLDRAKRYSEWAVRCRPDSARTHENLGDYYVAIHDVPAARACYKEVLRKETSNASVQSKLVKLD